MTYVDMRKALAVFVVIFGAAGPACSGPPSGPSLICGPGMTQVCACGGGQQGAQACLADGSGWGACLNCAGGTTGPTETCGNGRCAGAETCQSCPADCSCTTPTGRVPPGGACSTDADCARDPNSGNRALCTRDEGRSFCASTCSTNGDCMSNCCAARNDAQRVCSEARFCAPPPGRVPPGGACSTDADCAPDPGSGVRAYCTRYADGSRCASSCASNGQCASGCCARRDDGVRVCSAVQYCTSCTRQVNEACSMDSDCCPDRVSGRRAYCTRANGVATCRASCATNRDCASGCCARRDDGVYICSAPQFCG